MQLTESFAPLPYGKRATHETCRQRTLKGLGHTVGDVEHRRHLVAILGRIAAGRKSDSSYKVRIDNTQSLLLARRHQLRTVNLDTVYIHGIFIIGAASNGIL